MNFSWENTAEAMTGSNSFPWALPMYLKIFLEALSLGVKSCRNIRTVPQMFFPDEFWESSSYMCRNRTKHLYMLYNSYQTISFLSLFLYWYVLKASKKVWLSQQVLHSLKSIWREKKIINLLSKSLGLFLCQRSRGDIYICQKQRDKHILLQAFGWLTNFYSLIYIF